VHEVDRVGGLLFVTIGSAKAYPIVPLSQVASGNLCLPLERGFHLPNAESKAVLW
jgi:hypothetical protein